MVGGARLDDADRHRTRVLLLDRNHRIIGASDGRGVLSEHIAFEPGGRSSGFTAAEDGSFLAFHATPGYETYRGLGWYGVIVQTP